jgi:hypothetical protein
MTRNPHRFLLQQLQQTVKTRQLFFPENRDIVR